MGIPQSPLQRRYYWAIVRHVAKTFYGDGWRAAERTLHEEFKGALLGYEDGRDKNGNPFVRPISTADLLRDEFSCYIEGVIAMVVEAGVDLPCDATELLDVAPAILCEYLPTPARCSVER